MPTVACKLELPASALIHPVVHVSQLKKQIPPNTEVLDSLDSVTTDQTVQYMPVQVIAEKIIQKGTKFASQVLIKWDKLPQALATWENPQDMHRTTGGIVQLGVKLLVKEEGMSATVSGPASHRVAKYKWAMGRVIAEVVRVWPK